MIDKTTQKLLRVKGGGGEMGSYLMVSLAQLKEVQALLDRHQVPYWVEENAISLGGRPPIAFIVFSQSIDWNKVQEILDSVP